MSSMPRVFMRCRSSAYNPDQDHLCTAIVWNATFEREILTWLAVNMGCFKTCVDLPSFVSMVGATEEIALPRL